VQGMRLRDGRRLDGTVPYVLLGVGLLALSVAMWSRAWVTGDPASSIPCGCGDPGLNLWTIQWVAWSVTHLHDPFFTSAVYAGQGGANVLDTYNLLPGFLALPLTLALGPVVSFNVLVTLVPVANGLAMFFLLRKVNRYLPGDVLASVVYAFLPFFVDNEAFAHFNVDVAFLPPLLLWCVHDLLVDRRHAPVRVGLLAGVLCVLQFFLGPEQLAMGVVMGGLGVVIAVAVAPRLLWERRVVLLKAGAAAAGLAAVGLAYPAWTLLAGARHTSGPVWPSTPIAPNNLAGLVDPGAYGSRSTFDVIGGYAGSQGPAISYIGIAVLLLIGLSAVVWWRRRLARSALLAGTVALFLSLGIGQGKGSQHWLPWRIFYRMTVLDEILPGRFVLFTDVAIVLLVAMSLRGWWEQRDRVRSLAGRLARRAPRSFEPAWAALWCTAFAAAFVPVLLTEGLPITEQSTSVPAWFLDVAPTLRSRPTVLVLPDATSGATSAMVWQAEADFSFSMVGGYAIVPGPTGHTSVTIEPLGGTTALLDTLSFGFGPLPTPSVAQTAMLRSSLAAWGVQVIVVTPEARGGVFDADYLTAVLGRLPSWQDGAWVWYGLGNDPSFGVGPSTLLHCTFSVGPAPLAGPRCVLAAVRTKA
jgi:hypothetical protein